MASRQFITLVCACAFLTFCVSVCLSVNKIPAEQIHRIWWNFHLMVAQRTGLLESVTLGQKSNNDDFISFNFQLKVTKVQRR